MVKRVGMDKSNPKQTGNGWEEYLEADEELLWQGAPDGGIHFTFRGLGRSLFGLIFFSFAIFWITQASRMGGLDSNMPGAMANVFPLFGIPFAAIGFYMFIGHWFFNAFKRRRSRYALTNQRAIIATRVFGKQLKSYPITKSKPITIVGGPLESVNFDSITKRGSKGSTYTTHIGFQYLTDGPIVYKMMRDLQHKLGRK